MSDYKPTHLAFNGLVEEIASRDRRIASLEAELANARAIARGVTHHDECWRQSPEYARMVAENEQLRVQLAGCGVAALGGTKDPAKKNEFGWSPAYQDVLTLRIRFEELKVAVNKVWEVASGECQVAMDDTQGMEWISDYLSSIEIEDE